MARSLGMAGFRERLSEWVCRRSFSPTEAVLYETTVAPAVSEAVVPVLDEYLDGASGLWLDVGCGGGRITERLHQMSGRVVGIDPSGAQVRSLRRRARVGLSAIQATADRLPFDGRSFGAVVASCSYKHWPDRGAALLECARVADDEAPIVIVEIDAAAEMGSLRAFARMTRFPPVLRDAYANFLARTVLPASVTVEQFRSELEAVPSLAMTEIKRIDGLPFLMASLRVSTPPQ
jgi:ubiquinone/menaquinone biosynthesis C-methylase UbiE